VELIKLPRTIRVYRLLALLVLFFAGFGLIASRKQNLIKFIEWNEPFVSGGELTIRGKVVHWADLPEKERAFRLAMLERFKRQVKYFGPFIAFQGFNLFMALLLCWGVWRRSSWFPAFSWVYAFYTAPVKHVIESLIDRGVWVSGFGWVFALIIYGALAAHVNKPDVKQFFKGAQQ
jgi:hypothetical protein